MVNNIICNYDSIISMITLNSVYNNPKYINILYELLKERNSKININHSKLPSLKEHKKFVDSKPYEMWDFIEVCGIVVGSLCVTKKDEVGIFIFKKHQNKGYGKKALTALLWVHSGRLLANINLKNKRSIALFKKLGFKHIQNTYERVV